MTATAVAPSSTPGQMLRETKERREREAAEARLRGIARDAAARIAHERAIREAFSEGLSKAIGEILAGGIPKAMRLPRVFEAPSMHGVTISAPRHPDHGLYLEFLPQAAKLDLVPEVAYAHDGVGLESWHVLTFEPA